MWGHFLAEKGPLWGSRVDEVIGVFCANMSDSDKKSISSLVADRSLMDHVLLIGCQSTATAVPKMARVTTAMPNSVFLLAVSRQPSDDKDK